VTIVVDASILIRLLTNDPADHSLRQKFSPLRAVHAPSLLDAEVASSVRGLLLGRKIDPPRATAMLSDFMALRITRHTMQPYLFRVIELRNNFTAYGAFYVALAETLQIPLLTQDMKFDKAAGHRAVVDVYQ
jgi:predicted nucleic acid-binding protein